MIVDERRLRRRIQRLDAIADGGRRAAEADAVARAVADARRRVELRRSSVPELRYPAALPVSERRDDILAAIRDNQVVIVSGDTGSGKTTQLPKICLALGRGVRGLIGHTQPRRLAARTVAERIAEELDTPLGGIIGYTVRFTDRVGEDTLVKLMTDGILLAELQRDRMLARYDTLIIDEAHERSLNIDFILGYVKRLLPRRPDLKVLVTSATIDTARFSRHFGDAPIVEVSGRTYPVEIRYRPLDDTDGTGRDQVQAVCDAVDELAGEGPGDILVFLSGEREIRDTAEAVRGLALPDMEVLPLYARLSAAEQHRVFRPHSGRRVVLATNVAETSLTVPGIRYVVDAGTARISRYSRRTKVQRLPIEPVSRASADQRAGRCGRVGPGICIRLFSEEDYLDRPAYTDPEILRTNLASVILQMAAIGLGDVAAFPFVDPPDARAVNDGVALLEEVGAFTAAGGGRGTRLTSVGRSLAQLPVDPRLGRMILEAAQGDCLREVLVIAAGLSIPDPRERPAGREQAAAELHDRFAVPGSDLLGYLRLWEYLDERQRELSRSQFRRMCRDEHLNYLRIREWQDVHGQLRLVARGMGLRPNRQPAPPDRVHQSVLAGLLSHVGMWDPARREYRGARNARFSVAPGSVLFKRSPRWVMAAELVETNRLWGRNAAAIRPEWAERAAPHLVKRSYGDPYWDRSRGAAVVEERVTLYGLPVVPGRRVDYARLDPAGARAMFIRHALVEGDWEAHHAFLRHNRTLIEELRAFEDRARRRDLVVDEDGLYDLYDERLGEEVVSGRHFDGWWKRTRTGRPDLLTFSADLLLSPAAKSVSPAAYPDVWRQGDVELPLRYRFDPGADTDGLTVEVPVALLNQVEPTGFEWLVPGWREELVTALIRALPKPLRRHLVPANEHARRFLEQAGPEDGPLLDAFATGLGRMAGIDITPDAIRRDRVPGHLVPTFRVVGEDGATLAQGTDLDDLKRALQPSIRSALAAVTGSTLLTGCTEWEFGTIDRAVEQHVGAHTVRGYPALVDEGHTVGLEVLPTPEAQQQAMWAGTRRLLQLGLPGAAGRLQRRLTNRARLALAHAPHGTAEAALDDCVACALDRLIGESGGPAWDEAGFTALRAAVRGGLAAAAAEVADAVAAIVATAGGIDERMARLTAPALQPALIDIAAQLGRLLAPGFVAAVGWDRLADLERYLQAVERRLDRLPEAPARDRERMEAVRRLESELDRLVSGLPPGHPRPEVEHVRWMLEELRVSLWAQTLRTPYPVSEARVRRAIDGIRSA